MPKISLYINQQTLDKIKSAAKREHLSVSRWVAEQIGPRVENVYPAGFEELFGSVDDESFRRPQTKQD